MHAYTTDEEDDVFDDDEPTGSSSFGALHFLTIFILIGAAVVIGYLCLHNRKKVRVLIIGMLILQW